MDDSTMTPRRVCREYDAALRFNQATGLYDCVETNENFFIGKQWEGVQANGLPTPVFNFLKRVVLFSVANVSTDNLKLRARPMAAASAGQDAPARRDLQPLADVLNDQFAALFEQCKMGQRIRQFVRNAAVDGDGCLYAWWDPNVETGQAARGGVRVEVLQNTQVLFGNPNDREVQDQPYLLIERRMLVEEARRLRREARQLGENGRQRAAGPTEPSYEDEIQPDGKESGDPRLDQLGGGKVTVLTRLWRDPGSGTIHAYQCTRSAELRPEWDLGIRLYPLVWMNWDYVQNSYHGQAMITGLIPNQIFVNKLFAMCMISLMTLAYPKVIYDQTRIARWSSRVGAAIGVNGSVDGAARVMDPASVSPQISQFIQLAVDYTQRFLGASDAALGDARPDNSSAIIALQRAAATPLELTRQSLLQSIEDLGRIFMEFMAACYGWRLVEVKRRDGTGGTSVPFDFSCLRDLPCGVELDVGASSYWSEIAAMQTLDNLLAQGKISTAEYLRRLPDGQISDREALIEALERQGGTA